MTRLLAPILIVAIALAAPARAGITDAPDGSFLWNSFGTVEVVDSFAIVTSDYGLAALELNPVTGFFDPVDHLILNTQPISAKVANHIALVSSSAGLTYLIDLTELPQLRLLGQLDLGASVYDFALAGDDLYLACGFQGLRHYRLTDYAAPEFVDSSLAGVHCVQVDVRSDDLLVLDDYNGVLLYDLASAGIQAPVKELLLPRRAQSFYSIRDTLVIPIVDQPFLYRGLLDNAKARLLDSAVLGLVPERVYAIDTFLVAIDTDHNLMEVVSTEGQSHTLYDIHGSPELQPTGCTYHEDGIPHLLLVSDYDGLVKFNLENIWFDPEPRQAYGRPGPVTALDFQNQRLITGGERNPLEVYTLDSDGRPVFDTALFGLNNVGTVVDAGEAVLAHFPTVGLISAIRFGSDSIETLGSLAAANQGVRDIRYHDYSPVDSLSMVLTVRSNSVDIISVSDTWQMIRVDAARTLEGILDVFVVDSFLIVTTVDRQLHMFRVFNSFRTVLWWTVATPAPINHIVRTGEREAEDGSRWYPDIILGFSGNEMYEIVVREDAFPIVLPLATLPVDVIKTALADNLIYSIGNQGIAQINLGYATPTVDAYGGYGGHLIAFGDSTLATSDGRAVHLYSFKQPSSGTPDENRLLAVAGQYLRPNYPNPFNPMTRIEFYLPQPVPIEISVYNLLGRRVVDLLSGSVEAGLHSVEWDGTDRSGRPVASGVYFYRLSTPTFSETRKMVLLK